MNRPLHQPTDQFYGSQFRAAEYEYPLAAHRILQQDWNRAWQEACIERRIHREQQAARNGTGQPTIGQKEFWNKRAPSFARHNDRSCYVDEFLKKLAPQPHWSVLDVGCGAGTLALPLSPLVREVTGIDFSAKMLALLDSQQQQRRLTNISTRLLAWEDDWDSAGLPCHDVAIASRSLIAHDLCGAVNKLNSRARKRVVITSMVGDGPHDPRLYMAVGRPMEPRPDYIYLYNLLWQMGIRAELSFIVNPGEDRIYGSVDEAVEASRWMLKGLNTEEERRLRIFYQENSVPVEGGLRLREPHVIRWAYISWDKSDIGSGSSPGS